MLPLPKKTRPPKDPNAERLYAETETLKLPPPPVSPKPVVQKEIKYPLSRRHRKTGYPHVVGPVGVKRVPLYFIDRCKDIVEEFKKIHRYGKAKHYLDTAAFYDPKDPDTLYQQAIYHSHFNQYDLTLAKAEECLAANPKDYKALLLKADTHFRMCDFENALRCYSEGFGLRFPYKNWFQDGYYRTKALLYNMTSGKFPMFYGGNMRVFYRLVQGQERGQGHRIFNDTYKHYDELYPLEPNLTGLQEEINMFHVSKPRPPDHVKRRTKKAAVQQLKCSKKILGGFWDHKLEVEKHLIKKEYAIPHCGRHDRTEYIERALHFLKSRIDRFEVICAMMKNNELRNMGKRIDWLAQYGRWMAADKQPSVIPPARTGGLETSRYRWALSQTLFDLRNKTLDVCWIRTLQRNNHVHRLFSQRRPWRYFTGYRSAQRGALAAVRATGHDDWSFMEKLYTNVLKDLETSAPPDGSLPIPKHIREIEEQVQEFHRLQKSVTQAEQLVMPTAKSEQKDKLYYDPEQNIDQWDENREMLRKSILKREDKPAILPATVENRPIPSNLLEVFETRVHDDPDAWEKRRKMSQDLRESLARAEAAQAAHAVQERIPMFASKMAVQDKPKPKEKKLSDTSDASRKDEEDEDASHGRSSSTAQPDTAVVLPEDGEAEDTPKETKRAPKVRRPGERPRYDILDKKSEADYLYRARLKRRIPKHVAEEETVVVEASVINDVEQAAAQLEAERLLAAKAEDPYEIARRNFDNQKALYLDKAYNALMTCTKPAEFVELENAIGNLLDSNFPPKDMRFPNGDPIMLKGHPPPGPVTRPPISEYFANRNRPKPKKKKDARPVVVAEDMEAAPMDLSTAEPPPKEEDQHNHAAPAEQPEDRSEGH